jgi:hypothetical protein
VAVRVGEGQAPTPQLRQARRERTPPWADRLDRAEQNYVRVHSCSIRYLLRGTLTALEERLEPARLIRIRRSRIFDVNRVEGIAPWSHADRLMVLRDGTELLISRRYRDRSRSFAFSNTHCCRSERMCSTRTGPRRR